MNNATILKRSTPKKLALYLGFAGIITSQLVMAEDVPTSATPSLPDAESWAIHGQLTNFTQANNRFTAPYAGTNSLLAQGRTEETTDISLFLGRRLWRGAEVWIDPEIDQGFGVSNTLGLAGYSSGEAYKVGANSPYLRLTRAFIRQTIALGENDSAIESAPNQLAGAGASNNITLTAGKFSVTDIFDTNIYAHDPRADFMNWSIIDSGAFDYAADVWGFTYGAAAEWSQDNWTLRAGYFQLSPEPNAKIINVNFSQHSLVMEAELRQQWFNHPGKIKLLAFTNHAKMGSYQDALALAQTTGGTPDTALVRQAGTDSGFGINVEQELATDIGAFARISQRGGSKEAYEFSDINQSLSAGVTMKGQRWGRNDDTLGLAGAINGLSSDARAYFAAGGLGLLIGDGQLNYAPEKIVEMYYSARIHPHATITADYQYITNPAYNQARGPVSLYGVRLHAEF